MSQLPYPLFARFPGLQRRVDRIPLADLPTPVERAPTHLAAALGSDELWVKRDDLTAPVYGGNKVRKLELILGRAIALGRRSVWTTGARGSNHALATAIYGARLGLDVHATLYPQPPTAHVERNRRALAAAGAFVREAPNVALVPAVAAAQVAAATLRGDRPFLVPPGGSDLFGTLGYVAAGLELGEQIAAGACPRPDRIFVAAGTLGTAAGLAVGLAAAGVLDAGTHLVAVAVVEAIITNRSRLAGLVQRVVAHLERHGRGAATLRAASRAELVLEERALGAGYGHPTFAARHAVALFDHAMGIPLEMTYTGKAAGAIALPRRARERGGVDLFWNTVNSRPLPGISASVS